MSRSGRNYKAANGSRIPNLGQLRVDFRTKEGHKCGMPFQVAAVERPLVAVSQLAAAGNTVTLHRDHGVIKHDASGKEIRLQRQGASTFSKCGSRVFRGRVLECVTAGRARRGWHQCCCSRFSLRRRCRAPTHKTRAK